MYNILIADDEPTIRDLLRRLIALLPYTTSCTTAADGEELLAVFDRTAAHLVVTDDQMPHHTGLDVIRAIRQSHASIPIVFLSGTPAHFAHALAAGATTVLQKPFQIDEALATLNTLLEPH
jgi:CheY-like chemotaxis protein